MREYTDGKYNSTISFVKLINTTHNFVIKSPRKKRHRVNDTGITDKLE